MRPGNTIVFAQVGFGLVPEILDPVDVILPVGEQYRMINPLVLDLDTSSALQPFQQSA